MGNTFLSKKGFKCSQVLLLKKVIFVCYYFTSNVQSCKTTITNILRVNILSFQKRASVFLALRNYLFFVIKNCLLNNRVSNVTQLTPWLQSLPNDGC